MVREDTIEYGLIGTLQHLKYEYRRDITDRATLEQNFREKFEALNRVRLTDGEFAHLLDEIVTPDVFTRDDGTPLNYTLVNIKDWCKNTFEVINHHQDAALLHAALHRQQPDEHPLLRQQQRPSFRLQCRRAFPSYL